MLTQFSVKNYKCIKNLNILDLQAVSISEHQGSLLVDCNDSSVLPVSVIYGPNGSGKSTVLDAYSYLISKIVNPVFAANNKQQIYVSAPCIPFKFSQTTIVQQSEFNIVFSTKIAEYDYEIKIKGNQVLYEKLQMTSKKKERITTNTLFERNGNIVECKNEFKDIVIDKEVSSDISILSFICILYKNNIIIKDIFSAISKMLCVSFSNSIIENFNQNFSYDLYRKSKSDNNIKSKYINILNEMDINIIDYNIEELNDQNKSFRFFTTHNVDNLEFQLSVNEESAGTQKILTLIPTIDFVLQSGGTLLVDELDAKIHPLLLKYIINLFTNKKTNKNQAQLIFTSHDMSTMDKDVFRRDEIWFTAQNDEQATSLYSLVEFKDEDGKKTRKDASYSKQYLEGKYGADPYIKKILNWDKFYG